MFSIINYVPLANFVTLSMIYSETEPTDLAHHIFSPLVAEDVPPTDFT